MEHIFSCRYEPVCSTKNGRTPSGAGIRIFALKGKPRKRRDPPESPALLYGLQGAASAAEAKRVVSTRMGASTGYLPESVYAEVEVLANKSGKKGSNVQDVAKP